MHLCQIKLLAAAISSKQRTTGLNMMNWNRVAFHADSKDFAQITKDLQRN